MSLFEQFIISGLNLQNKDITYQDLQNKTQGPEILQIYPEIERMPSHLENFQLWSFAHQFNCYKEDLQPLFQSNIQFNKESKINPIHQLDRIYHFILTDEYGKRRYCSSLLFYEKIYVKNIQKHSQTQSKCFPKIQIDKILKNPLILDDDTSLIYAPKSLSFISLEPNFDCQRQCLKFLYTEFVIQKENQMGYSYISLPKSHLQKLDSQILTYGIQKAEELWDENQVKLENLSPKYTQNSISYAVQHKIQSELNFVFQSTLQIGKFMNLMINQKNEVIYKCLKASNEFEKEQIIKSGESQSIWSLLKRTSSRTIDEIPEKNLEFILRYKNSQEEFMSLENFSYKPLVKKLSAKNIIKLIMYILQEKQILIFSQNQGKIPLITEALLSLIRPFKWNCIYIPFCPKEIWEIATALQPFIIGFERKHKEFVLDNLDCSNKVIVDLDKNSVEYIISMTGSTKNGLFLVDLPQDQLQLLETNLERIIQEYDFQEREKVFIYYPNNFYQTLQWISIVLLIKKSFFHFIVSLIKNVIPYFKSPKERETDNQVISSIKSIFDFRAYHSSIINSQKQFLEYISNNTMLFIDFLENLQKHIFDLNNCEQDKYLLQYISYFSEDRALKDTLNFIEIDIQQKMDKQFLNFRFPTQINIYPYLIKYIKYLELAQIEKIRNNKRQIQRISQFQNVVKGQNQLYFFNEEQRRLTRLTLNKNETKFSRMKNDRLVNLCQIFTKKLIEQVTTDIIEK